MSAWFTSTVSNGSMLLAMPIALFAGLVSFLSPCIIPMLPGYLSYVTGLSGQEIATGSVRRSRMLVGSVLFVIGFTAVFVLMWTAFSGLGLWLLDGHRREIMSRVLGGIVFILGLSFMGLLPVLQRDWRVHKIPSVGLAAAPVIGFLFGLGWSPCIGPTLGAIQTVASLQGSQTKGTILVLLYSLGIGIPFILSAVLWRRAVVGLAWIKRHQRWVSAIGGLMMMAVGVALLTGAWDTAVQWLQIHLVDKWQGVAV
ncbi:cytochrome C biogenesis protein CcdA [Nocardioides baekrokdamisoli]|uniref:Cytochrome C biogenesis protein CcdA n=1 Tax=Nocardioides baekrokdamisoli TaxID=1804624 RepID=A0A3G9IHL9_9ACTN|nr:cytochrome c biogenesis protein CcdA [Nocardioides baekrokdamisoli]BBH17836.1 cytochrome C biogenesis protein CcdA [Nocardioides baekrokdamisoli]